MWVVRCLYLLRYPCASLSIEWELHELKNNVPKRIDLLKKLTSKNLLKFDLVILITDHDCFDYKFINKNAKKIIDCRGKFSVSEKVIRG